MKKNDKLIVIFGVIILVLSSIGIYSWDYEEGLPETVTVEDFIGITGSLKDMPQVITVSDSNPFYPVIVTPLAVNYNEECEQSIAALLVKNLTDPSTGVTRLIGEQLQVTPDLEIGNSKSAKDLSLEIINNYWEKSDAVLLIENNEQGYNLGIAVAPIASYLSIPIIVTDEIDAEVRQVLSNLGVKYSMICGDIEGYGDFIRFENIDEIVDFSIEIVREKFGDVEYITLTNPLDAWPPEVIDRTEFFLEPQTIKSTSMSQLVGTIVGAATGAGTARWSFTIPKDYKYAVVKFEGINHNIDGVEEFGDSVSFGSGVNLEDVPRGLQSSELITGSTGKGGIAEVDVNGKITADKLYQETVLYDRGGAEYTVTATGSWLVEKEGKVSANVVVEKLEHPKYALMKGLSTIAPYLTAYRKGIIFAKPEFAFTADDNIITDKGQTCPGFYVPRRNPDLVPLSNKHIFDEIHDPLNEILAKLVDITIEDDTDIKPLRNHYASNPIYIALVGGGTMIPNYIFQNHVEPFGDIDGDGVDDTPYWVGGGTPSDVIYGNIDPVHYDWSNLAKDVYSETEEKYPYIENIVGRITGWDAQDASALIARTVLYEEIIEKLGEWKDNFGLLMGGGSDFQKPLVRYIIFGDILGMVKRGEPMKYWTGYTEMVGKRTINQVVEPLGFDLLYAYEEEALRKGLSEDALDKIKKANLLNRLFFLKPQVRKLVGEGNVKGGEIMESSNFILANGHGCQNTFGMSGNKLPASGFGGPIMQKLLEKTFVPIFGSGFLGPGGNLDDVGDYGTRDVANMNFGPSFFWLESCICGKIDGVYPKSSVGQALLHAGVTSLIASPTGSNIGGGYLEPKKGMYDRPGQVMLRYLQQKGKWDKGIFPDAHFGFRVFADMCEDLRENDATVGMALRNARNSYFCDEEMDWVLWWSPPLIDTGNALLDYQMNKERMKRTSSKLGTMDEAKFVTFQEYLLFGDPAFNPYDPINEGT